MDYRLNVYNRPIACRECNGIMIYTGLGEFVCEDCGFKDLDDYGKVRNYLEEHPGSTISDIHEETGVTKKSINYMLKESRFEVTQESRTFLICEKCGMNIRTGRFCEKCEGIYHKEMEDREREERKMAGYGKNDQEFEKGSKRFRRDY